MRRVGRNALSTRQPRARERHKQTKQDGHKQKSKRGTGEMAKGVVQEMAKGEPPSRGCWTREGSCMCESMV